MSKTTPKKVSPYLQKKLKSKIDESNYNCIGCGKNMAEGEYLQAISPGMCNACTEEIQLDDEQDIY